MADPVFNEDHIIALLRMPILNSSLGALQAGAIQSMIDLFDRKVTREEFVEQLAPCIALYGTATKMWLLDNIEAVHDDGDLNKEKFKAARAALVELARKQSETVVELVKRLQMCPSSQDKVH